MPNVFHVHADLVGTTSLQDALYECHVSEPLEYFVVGDSFLAMVALRISFKQFPEALVPAHMGDDGSFVLLNIPPHQCNVFPLDGVIKELFCRMHAAGASCENARLHTSGHRRAGIF